MGALRLQYTVGREESGLPPDMFDDKRCGVAAQIDSLYSLEMLDRAFVFSLKFIRH